MTVNIPPSWARTALGNVFEIVGGATPRTNNSDYWDGDISWLTPDDLSTHDGILISKGRRSITKAGFASTSTHLLPAGTILFSSRAPIGYTAIAANPVCTNQGFKSLVPPVGIEPLYVFWYLCHATPEIRELGSGTTFKELSKKRMASVPFVLAPTAEQRRIVAAIEDHISHLDAARDAITAAQARIEALRRSVLAEAFAGRLVSQDPDDEPASVLLDRIAADRGTKRALRRSGRDPNHPTDDLPPGWILTTLGEVCMKPQYGWTTKSSPILDGLPYLRTTDISQGRVNWDSVPSCVDVPDDVDKFLLRDGDIVVSRAGSVGVSHLIESPPRAVFASYLIRLGATSTTHPRYLAHYLKSPMYWTSISETSIGIAIPNVSAKKLAAIPIPVAPRREQRRIVTAIDEHFSRLDAAADALEGARARIEASRRSVLAEAFAGRLVPQNPADEPASVLLDRIAASK